jgi:hypothetical protein
MIYMAVQGPEVPRDNPGASEVLLIQVSRVATGFSRNN